MRIMGIEFAGSTMNYVVLESRADGTVAVEQWNRLVIGGTRSRDALLAFQNAVTTLFNVAKPELIGIKEKPEAGRLQASAASLKMEGIVLANAPCGVDFVSGARVNGLPPFEGGLHAYMTPAVAAARAALVKRCE